MKVVQLIFIILFLAACQHTEEDKESLSTQEIKEDLEFLDNLLQQTSSYVKLNDYDYSKDFTDFLKQAESAPISKTDLGLFLTKVIGKIGDRHASVSRYDLLSSKFFPFAFAPYKGKVAVLEFDKALNQYKFFNTAYPFLKSIENNTIAELLPQILPEEIKAPKAAYLTRAVRELRDIERIYQRLGKQIPNALEITLTDEENNSDTSFQVTLVNKEERPINWDEKFYRKYFNLVSEDTDYNLPEIYSQLFTIDENIAYVHLPKMVDKEEAPKMFEELNRFMQNEGRNKSDALIIDVRSNSGGGRELIMELASYIIHPDSIHVVNVAQQRGEIPLSDDWRRQLHHRYLFSFEELNAKEQKAVRKFEESFEPMYELDTTKYSEYYYCILNGSKITKKEYYYNRPIYVLANERSFSAASVLVGLLKGLPNVKTAGITTDGSSGNSEAVRLPNSRLRVKVSTMVSFQKDGKIFDGYGTEPDIVIERELDQLFWKTDTQLEELKKIIKSTFDD